MNRSWNIITQRGSIGKALLLVAACIFLNSCASKIPDLKSPCAGIEGSPCSKRHVNDWWAKA